MNIQFAIKDDDRSYVLEVNPRASRTVPFVSKATGVPLARDRRPDCMAGKTLDEIRLHGRAESDAFFVKEASSRSTSSPAWTSSSARRCARPAR